MFRILQIANPFTGVDAPLPAGHRAGALELEFLSFSNTGTSSLQIGYL